MKEPEVWKPIAESEGKYEVSNYGRVRGLKYGPRVMKPFPSGRGYMTARVLWNGRLICKPLHRLVLDAFVGPRPDGMVCRHLDGNPCNNSLENLCWGTHKENAKDALAHGVLGGPPRRMTPEERELALQMAAIGQPPLSIARRIGVSFTSMRDFLKGKTYRSWRDARECKTLREGRDSATAPSVPSLPDQPEDRAQTA